MNASATRSPRSLARAYAQFSTNWDWRTLRQQLERLQELAGKPLLDELVQTAETVRSDESLTRDRSGARGRVDSVTVKGSGATRRLVVVTREEQLHDGQRTLEGPLTHVYTGKATRARAGWRMVEWRLEP